MHLAAAAEQLPPEQLSIAPQSSVQALKDRYGCNTPAPLQAPRASLFAQVEQRSATRKRRRPCFKPQVKYGFRLPNNGDRPRFAWLSKHPVITDGGNRRKGNLLLRNDRGDSPGALPVSKYFLCRLPPCLPQCRRMDFFPWYSPYEAG